MYDEFAVAGEDGHVAGLQLVRMAQVEKISRLQAGEHTGAGYGQASVAEGGQDFGGQVEFDGVYQAAFITRL